MSRPQPRMVSQARAADRTVPRLLMGLAAGALLALGAGMVRAQDLIRAHGFSTYGDLKYPADFARLDYVNPDAPRGGEISTWAQGTFDTMNPYAAEGRAGALSNSAYESLMTGTADEISGAYCLLCEYIEYPEDRSFIRFHMRPEARFSDGTPVTAHDVLAAHELFITQGLPSYADVVSSFYSSVTVDDDYTITFTLTDPLNWKDAWGTAAATPVWSRAWFEANPDARLDESRMEIPPGSGAYVLDSVDPGRQVIYRRNPDYWGDDLPINIGRNNFDTIRVEYFADSTAAFEAFKAGEFTFRVENSSLSWATAYEFPALENGWVVRAELPDGNLPGATGMVFNLRRDKFQDIRVRQAIALMYNFTWTNNTLQYGLFEQRESFWQNSDMAAMGVPEGRELELLQSVADMIDPAILTEPVTVPHTSGEEALDRTNLRAALALMEEAGWTSGDDGMLRNADGEMFTLEFLSDNPNFERIIVPYIENLRALGVDATWNLVDPAQFTDRERGKDFDMIFSGYTNGLEEGGALEQRYGSAQTEDVFNDAGYSSPAVDKLINDVIAATTREEMAAAVRAIDRIMRRELYVIPAWYKANHWVAYYDMYGYPENLPPYSLGQLDFWWHDAEGEEALRAAGALN
jgi:microcin C transport system substrate-binding protein